MWINIIKVFFIVREYKNICIIFKLGGKNDWCIFFGY